jgi:voltage-gated potassium channel
VLRAAGIERARGLVCAVDSDATNVYVTVTARALNPGLMIVARASRPGSVEVLRRAGADRVVSPYALSGTRMAFLALRPAVVDFLDMVTVAPDLRLEEVVVTPGTVLDGLAIGRIGEHVPDVTVVAVRKAGGSLVRPEPEQVLAAGDLVVVLGPAGRLDAVGR